MVWWYVPEFHFPISPSHCFGLIPSYVFNWFKSRLFYYIIRNFFIILILSQSCDSCWTQLNFFGGNCFVTEKSKWCKISGSWYNQAHPRCPRWYVKFPSKLHQLKKRFSSKHCSTKELPRSCSKVSNILWFSMSLLVILSFAVLRLVWSLMIDLSCSFILVISTLCTFTASSFSFSTLAIFCNTQSGENKWEEVWDI